MKTVFSSVLLALFFGSTSLIAQTGMATYKTAMKMNVMLDSTKMSASQQELIQKQLMKAMQKEYELSFSATESNWKELEQLDVETGGNDNGIRVAVTGIGGGSDGLLYKNTKDKTSLETADAFGKLFLVSGDLVPYEWKLTSEAKQIGNYTCYKATVEREVTKIKMTDLNGEREEKEEKSTQIITAWYTPQIPVNHGPDAYWGLPGLILEVSNGNRTMVCNKVILNPKDGISIEIPKKGKKVTSAEYGVLMREQSEKMRKMRDGGKRKGKNGGSIQISIDG